MNDEHEYSHLKWLKIMIPKCCSIICGYFEFRCRADRLFSEWMKNPITIIIMVDILIKIPQKKHLFTYRPITMGMKYFWPKFIDLRIENECKGAYVILPKGINHSFVKFFFLLFFLWLKSDKICASKLFWFIEVHIKHFHLVFYVVAISLAWKMIW